MRTQPPRPLYEIGEKSFRDECYEVDENRQFFHSKRLKERVKQLQGKGRLDLMKIKCEICEQEGCEEGCGFLELKHPLEEKKGGNRCPACGKNKCICSKNSGEDKCKKCNSNPCKCPKEDKKEECRECKKMVCVCSNESRSKKKRNYSDGLKELAESIKVLGQGIAEEKRTKKDENEFQYRSFSEKSLKFTAKCILRGWDPDKCETDRLKSRKNDKQSWTQAAWEELLEEDDRIIAKVKEYFERELGKKVYRKLDDRNFDNRAWVALFLNESLEDIRLRPSAKDAGNMQHNSEGKLKVSIANMTEWLRKWTAGEKSLIDACGERTIEWIRGNRTALNKYTEQVIGPEEQIGWKDLKELFDNHGTYKWEKVVDWWLHEGGLNEVDESGVRKKEANPTLVTNVREELRLYFLLEGGRPKLELRINTDVIAFGMYIEKMFSELCVKGKVIRDIDEFREMNGTIIHMVSHGSESELSRRRIRMKKDKPQTETYNASKWTVGGGAGGYGQNNNNKWGNGNKDDSKYKQTYNNPKEDATDDRWVKWRQAATHGVEKGNVEYTEQLVKKKYSEATQKAFLGNLACVNIVKNDNQNKCGNGGCPYAHGEKFQGASWPLFNDITDAVCEVVQEGDDEEVIRRKIKEAKYARKGKNMEAKGKDQKGGKDKGKGGKGKGSLE